MGSPERPRRVLVVDVGGTNVKFLLAGDGEPSRFPSGARLTPRAMVRGVLAACRGRAFDAVSIGYPGPVSGGRPAADPANLGRGWARFDFRRAFGRPVKVMNDAAMQALGSYAGGRMLFLGLGTGLGSALVADGTVVPLELAHLPYRGGRTFEESVGAGALRRAGKKKWRRAVEDVVARLRAATIADYVVLGGGNVKKLRDLPDGARRGSNANAFIGGLRMWETEGPATSPSAARRR